jgi:hypothetical protein
MFRPAIELAPPAWSQTRRRRKTSTTEQQTDAEQQQQHGRQSQPLVVEPVTGMRLALIEEPVAIDTCPLSRERRKTEQYRWDTLTA